MAGAAAPEGVPRVAPLNAMPRAAALAAPGVSSGRAWVPKVGAVLPPENPRFSINEESKLPVGEGTFVDADVPRLSR